MADAEDVVRGITPKPGVAYTALWLNEKGFERARSRPSSPTSKARSRSTRLEKFLEAQNNNRTSAEEFELAARVLERYQELGIPGRARVDRGAFGCNYQGDIPVATHHGHRRRSSSWPTSTASARLSEGLVRRHHGVGDAAAIKKRGRRRAGAVPEQRIWRCIFTTPAAWASPTPMRGSRWVSTMFDSCGRRPRRLSVRRPRAPAGNVCTEDLVFMCQEMGIETGIDLDALIECARARRGHRRPSAARLGVRG